MKEGGREREVEGLHVKFHNYECVHCVGFQWPKTTIFGKF